MAEIANYSKEELFSIYEVGRLLYSAGHLTPASDIFRGLTVVDGGTTPARVGLGLIALEGSSYPEATNQFRTALQDGRFSIQARLGLSAVFVAQGEFSRARSLLLQLEPEIARLSVSEPEMARLWETFVLRCGA